MDGLCTRYTTVCNDEVQVCFVPDAAQLGAVVVPIDDVEQDLEHQLPQLAVLHQRDGEERIQEGRRQRSCHGLGLKARGYLR